MTTTAADLRELADAAASEAHAATAPVRLARAAWQLASDLSDAAEAARAAAVDALTDYENSACEDCNGVLDVDCPGCLELGAPCPSECGPLCDDCEEQIGALYTRSEDAADAARDAVELADALWAAYLDA